MSDVLTPEQRHRCMSNIKGKNTKPETIVRRLVYSLGFRYRLHRSDLPGKPDLAFIGRKKAIFFHGCFWHMHSCRNGQVKPKTNEEFWFEKRMKTKVRDTENQKALEELGWKNLIVWECEIQDSQLSEKIRNFLD